MRHSGSSSDQRQETPLGQELELEREQEQEQELERELERERELEQEQEREPLTVSEVIRAFRQIVLTHPELAQAQVVGQDNRLYIQRPAGLFGPSIELKEEDQHT